MCLLRAVLGRGLALQPHAPRLQPYVSQVRYARQGEARAPCLKLPAGTFLVARVPFTKNGGGDHLNQFTVTMHVKFIEELPEALYSTAGWDSWSKLQEGDDEAQLRLAPGGDGGGLPGAHETFGEAGPHNEVRLTPNPNHHPNHNEVRLHRVVHLPLSVPTTYYLLPTTHYLLLARCASTNGAPSVRASTP